MPSYSRPPSSASMAPSSSSQSLSGASAGTSVQVALRIRPPLSPEQSANIPARFQRSVVTQVPGSETSLAVDSSTTNARESTMASPVKGGNKQYFSFDRVFGPADGQTELFGVASGLVDRFVEGYNVTVLAYGQTSSGKSYTMGTDHLDPEELANGADRLGIIPRAVGMVFDRLAKMAKESKSSFSYQVKNSYIELYNEDLIDLLAEETEDRPQVTIREDKGLIIWSGLREMKVSNAMDVMSNLDQGSSVRQTNATDMNSQSSRSHAIFSLTLTQKKYTGQHPPTSPATPATPSRYGTPRASMSGLPSRVSSPAPGTRPSTPGDRPSSRFGLRPASAMANGRVSPGPNAMEDMANSKEDGEWVTVTSKWHFVDLAGSERLKRTSAMGERVKEGISINSGLHALGNVISALGDPARARQTTHIPYRDSKLTRLLQDSLGGNAHTLMIACVSPTEYNVNETLNTLKYANRARNIKNSATINEIEIGWQDLDHLQALVVKLRAELASLRSGNMDVITEERSNGLGGLPSTISSNAEVLQLQDRFAELSQKYAKLTAEMAKHRAPSRSSTPTPGANGRAPRSSLSPEDFAAAVEPVVEEYEKSLSAVESQLSLTRTALAHTEDALKEQGDLLMSTKAENDAHQQTIDNLKNRVAKLSEREKVAETYVRSLEDRIKASDDGSDSHLNTIEQLKREIARLQEAEANGERYIKDLEMKLGRSEDKVVGLKDQLDSVEKHLHRREEAYKELEERLGLLDTTVEHKSLLAELDQREKRLLDLGRELDELQLQNNGLVRDGSRQQQIIEQEQAEKAQLQAKISALEEDIVAVKTADRARYNLSTSNGRPPTLPVTPNEETSDRSLDADGSSNAAEQLRVLESRYRETVQELDTVNARYKDSLVELEELSQELQDAKLAKEEERDIVLHSNTSAANLSPSRTLHSSSREDLRAPPSMTVPLSPSRNRRSLPLGLNGSPNRASGSFLGRAAPIQSQSTHSRSVSLSQELQAQGSLFGSQTPSGHSRPTSPNPLRESMTNGSAAMQKERSYDSLAKEIGQLQNVLTNRESEIAELEEQLRILRLKGAINGDELESLSDTHLVPIRTDLPSTTDEADSPPLRALTPGTMVAFNTLRGQISDSDGAMDADNAARLDDLMRSMAQKEASHREEVDQLSTTLASLRKEHEALQTLSNDQVHNMSQEIEQLKMQLDGTSGTHSDASERLAVMEAELATKGAELAALDLRSKASLAATTEKMEVQHKDAMKAQQIDFDLQLVNIQEEHAIFLRRMIGEREELFVRRLGEHQAAIQSIESKHAQELSQVKNEHARQLRDLERARVSDVDGKASEIAALEGRLATMSSANTQEWSTTAEKLNREHDTALQSREAEFSLKMEESTALHKTALQAVENRYEAQINKLHEDHDAAFGQTVEAHSLKLQSLRQEHDQEIANLKTAHQELSSKQSDEHAKAIQEVRDTSAASVKRIENEITQLRSTAAEHLAQVGSRDVESSRSERRIAELQEEIKSLKSASESHSSQQKDNEWQKKVASLEASLAENEAILHEAIAEIAQRHKNELASRLQECEKRHKDEMAAVSATHAVALEEMRKAQIPSPSQPLANITTPQRKQFGTKVNGIASEDDAALREALSKAQNDLANMTEARNALQTEAAKHKALLRSMEDQQSAPISAVSPKAITAVLDEPPRLRSSSFGPKGPPPGPPPSGPPPPLPRLPSDGPNGRSRTLDKRDSVSSTAESSTTGARNSIASSTAHELHSQDPKVQRKIEEQEAQVAKLTKQLGHCESDLRANIDLVQTLESALNDTERILRKARMQMNDLVRERDTHEKENASLKKQTQDANAELETLRQSLASARRESDTRLLAERSQRDAARVELEQRLEAMRAKKSKYNCF